MNGIITVVGDFKAEVPEKIVDVMRSVITDVAVNVDDECIWVEDTDCIKDEADLDKLVNLVLSNDENKEIGVYTQFVRSDADGNEEYNDVDYYYVNGEVTKDVSGWRSLDEIEGDSLPCDTTLLFTFETSEENMAKAEAIIREAITDVPYEFSDQFEVENTLSLDFDDGVENLARSLARISPDIKFGIKVIYHCDDDLVQLSAINCSEGMLVISIAYCFPDDDLKQLEADKAFYGPYELEF